MIVSQDSDASTTRVAYAVGRSVGTAVQRNRVRRRLREVLRIRDAASRMPASTYLFICRPLSTSLTFSELADAVDRLLAAAHPAGDVTELTLT